MSKSPQMETWNYLEPLPDQTQDRVVRDSEEAVANAFLQVLKRQLTLSSSLNAPWRIGSHVGDIHGFPYAQVWM